MPIVTGRPGRLDYSSGEGPAGRFARSEHAQDARIGGVRQERRRRGRQAGRHIREDRDPGVLAAGRELVWVGGRVQRGVERIVGPEPALVRHPPAQEADIVRRGRDRLHPIRLLVNGSDQSHRGLRVAARSRTGHRGPRRPVPRGRGGGRHRWSSGGRHGWSNGHRWWGARRRGRGWRRCGRRGSGGRRRSRGHHNGPRGRRDGNRGARGRSQRVEAGAGSPGPSQGRGRGAGRRRPRCRGHDEPQTYDQQPGGRGRHDSRPTTPRPQSMHRSPRGNPNNPAVSLHP